ncbi:MAG: M48 family metalloprotease [Rickettsiales bacterium]|jgi:predicted Zn-dependent protease|nr:M48 family metalloprotease [Rickettsiales bacterium]
MKRIAIIFAVFVFAAVPPALADTRVIHDTEIESVIQKLVAPIAKAAKMPEGRLRIHILADNDLNAFVSGGEDIYVYAGTIMKLENPNALQAVIAHELGHIIGGHYTAMMSRLEQEMVASIIMQSLGIAVLAINPEAGAGMMMGLPGITKANLMSFSRDEERLADTTGLGLMKTANLPRGGFVDMMELMHSHHVYLESRGNPNDRSHPSTGERLMNIREWIAKNGGAGGELSADVVKEYQMARAKLIGYMQSEKAVADMYPDKKSAPAKYARAISDLRRSKLKTALRAAEELADSYKTNPYFFELIGDINMQSGRYSEAIDAYEKSLSLLDDDSMQISGALALALALRNKKDDCATAVQICKRALLLNGTSARFDPFLYFVMARAYSAQGKNGLSDWAMAEYYWATNKKKESKKFAGRAKKNLPVNSAEYQKVEDILGRKE